MQPFKWKGDRISPDGCMGNEERRELLAWLREYLGRVVLGT